MFFFGWKNKETSYLLLFQEEIKKFIFMKNCHSHKQRIWTVSIDRHSPFQLIASYANPPLLVACLCACVCFSVNADQRRPVQITT